MTGQKFEITIDRIAYGGNGVGRLPNGMVCFVPGVIAGEKAVVEVLTEKKRYTTAALLEVVEPSPHRIPVENPIPGGVYQHMAYDEENRVKQAQLLDFFKRGVPEICDACDFREPLIPSRPLQYRNKIVLHSQDGRLGYFMEDNRTVEDVPVCPLADPEISVKMTEIRSKMQSVTFENDDKVTIRHAANGVFDWLNGDNAGIPNLLYHTPCGELEVAPDGFYQVNNEGAAMMQNTVRAMLENLTEEPSSFLDLYCGAGFFSLAALAAGIRRIIGADIDPGAAAAATANLQKAGAGKDIRFYAFAADRIVGRLIKKGGSNPVLLVDPPRQGLDQATAQQIATSHIRELIYVSCGPDTLVRDLRLLGSAGFTVESNVMINMFPRTAHIESITRLRR
jgi:tRNA/tmRNA/rRNA uracil-C5-methylase (TrmA/RlmC/RlmD family)